MSNCGELRDVICVKKKIGIVKISGMSDCPAFAMAGVDYNEWGMDLEEWELIENGPPPPHLYADEFEVHEYEEEETYEVITTKDVYDKIEKDGDDDFVMQRLNAHDKSVNRNYQCLEGLKTLVIAIIVTMHEKFACSRGHYS
ncbi:hypothetical protein Tco_0472163 [Tanacetum coccineum]